MCNVLCLLLLAFCLPLKTRAAGRKFCFFWVEYQYLASDIIDSGFILLPPINSSCWYDFRGYPSFYPSIIYFYSHPYDFCVLSMLLSINRLLPLWFLFIHPSILVSGIKFPITTVGYGSICYQSVPFRSFVLLWVRTCIRYDFCHSDMSKAANDMFLRRSWFFFWSFSPVCSSKTFVPRTWNHKSVNMSMECVEQSTASLCYHPTRVNLPSESAHAALNATSAQIHVWSRVRLTSHISTSRLQGDGLLSLFSQCPRKL